MTLALVAAFAVVLAAAQEPAPFSSVDVIDIAGDRAEFLPGEGKTIITDNVRVVSGGAVLTAPKVVVFQGEAEGDIARIVATGGVRFAREGEAISGARAEYDGPARTITVTGNVLLTQGRQVARGERLVYHLDTERVELFGAPGKRVRGLFFTGDPG